MKKIHPLVIAAVIAVTSVSIVAQAQDQNKDRLGSTTQPATNRSNSSSNPMSQDIMKKMDAQMKAMQEIHQKMINAKTPEERNAIMAENIKAMEAGMSMMRETGMMGMPIMENMPMRDGTPMMDNVPIQNQMMQKRMDMMSNMMQMMMDRMNHTPGK